MKVETSGRPISHGDISMTRSSPVGDTTTSEAGYGEGAAEQASAEMAAPSLSSCIDKDGGIVGCEEPRGPTRDTANPHKRQGS